MNNPTATGLPAQTIVEVVSDLIESGSISIGARRTVTAAIAAEARRRGFSIAAPIDGDVPY